MISEYSSPENIGKPIALPVNEEYQEGPEIEVSLSESTPSTAVDSPILEHDYMKAKQGAEVSVIGVFRQNSSGAESDASKAELRAWTVHFFRLGPLAGIFSMLVAVLSILVSFGILIGSRGAPTKSSYADEHRFSQSFVTC